MGNGRTKWTQLTLMGENAVEVLLRVGLMPGDDHGQAQLEVRRASTQELLAMSSRPHFPLNAVEAEMTEWLEEFRAACRHYLDPFPG